MKRFLMILIVLGLVATGAFADPLQDSANWAAETNGGAYEALTSTPPIEDADWFEFGTPNGTVTDGKLTLTAAGGDWNGYKNESTPEIDKYLSIEWRLRDLTTAPTSNKNTFYSGFSPGQSMTMGFINTGEANEGIQIGCGNNDSDGKIVYEIETSAWHTYRVTATGSPSTWFTARLYVDDNPTAVAEATNTINWGGTETVNLFPLANGIIELDYVRWISDVYEPPVLQPGDVNRDSFVGGADLTQVMYNWGMTGASWTDGDVAGPGGGAPDGLVGADDWTAVVSNWATSYVPEPVPEPATLGLLVLGVLALIRRR